ncbi:MAG TPA: hypothetical protein PKH02_03425 [Bacteroidales bacterium]|jgi:bacteriocin-like protein|nr:hypothetical protein [Bacteroidales bacterium]
MRKTVNLTMLGVTELSKEEMQQTNGGWTRIFYTYIIMLAKEAVTEGLEKCFEDFKEGFEEGYNN